MRMYLCATFIVAVVLASGASAASSFFPPTFPTNLAPIDWPGNPGSRYEMPDYAAKIPPERRDLVMNVRGGTEADWKRNDLGTYQVGDQVNFAFVVGDKESRYFGSMKDGRDGGRYQVTILWMDESGQKVLAEDERAVKESCGSCGGHPNLYFNIPSYAKQGRQRLNLTYVHAQLKINLSKEFTFSVQNDGSWDRNAVLDRLATNCQTVIVLQSGRPVKDLGFASYDGVRDTYMMSPHPVPDRRADHCNFGKDVKICVGVYGTENRALVAFDLSRVPKNAVLAEAHLQLYAVAKAGGRGASVTPAAFEVLKPWTEGRGHADFYLSTNAIRAGETAWQWNLNPQTWSQGGCGDPGKDRSAESIGESARIRETRMWADIPLATNVVARWIKDPASNNGLILVDPQASRGDIRVDFHSSEFEDPAMRPRLILAFSSGFLAPTVCSPDGTCPVPAWVKETSGRPPPPTK